MATTIITDSLNLKIVGQIPANKINDLFVELGFEIIDIEKRKIVALMNSSMDSLTTALLTSWKTKHGCGLDQAETLMHVMKKHGVDGAAELIQEAIKKVFPDPPMMGIPMDENAMSTSTKEKTSPMKS